MHHPYSPTPLLHPPPPPPPYLSLLNMSSSSSQHSVITIPAFTISAFLPHNPSLNPFRNHKRHTTSIQTPLSVATTPHHPDHTTPLRTSPHPHTKHVQTSNPLHTHLLTILTPHNPTAALANLSHHITTTHGVLHPPRHLSEHAVEAPITLPPLADVESLHNHLFLTARQSSTDAVLQPMHTARAEKKLAVFDLDSTLIAQETIDELASELGLREQVMQITNRAMNGEIGFREALRQRVTLLKGLPLHALDQVKRRVRFTEGAHELVAALNALGCTTAVVSGGFHFLADHVRDVLGLHYSFANRLETDGDGLLTGRTVGEVVDAEFKESTLERLADLHHVSKDSILAVGDGSNDLLMMKRAGLGVAFNAKPIVQDKAKCRVNQASLRSVLYLLGQSDDDIDRLLTR